MRRRRIVEREDDAPMTMPKPTEAHRKLARFVGKWTIEETMHPSEWAPKGGRAQGRTEYHLGCDGFFLVCDYAQLRDGEETFRGHGVYGFDPKTNLYTMRWFDSMGHDPGEAATGTWDGDVLRFEHATSRGRARYTYTWRSDDEYAFRIENSADGETWKSFLDSVYTRAGE
jgi:hypothetical protein